jgi:hypothetical protein
LTVLPSGIIVKFLFCFGFDRKNVHHYRGYSDYIPQSSSASLGSHNSLVEGLQPIFQPHGQQSQPSLLSKQINLPIAESILPSEEPFTYEALVDSYHKQQNELSIQQQAIALLVDEKNVLASDLEKYSVMADRYKNSEALLKEGQLLVDALNRKNAELEEEIRNGEDRLKEVDEQKEKILESLQLQVVNKIIKIRILILQIDVLKYFYITEYTC